jgi:predicted CopG family antitoxin
VKTITIDMEAYRALKRHKGTGMSFSDVIKKHFGGVSTGATLLRALEDVEVTESTLDAMNRVVSWRADDPAVVESL